MASDDLKSIGIAIIIMAAINAFLLYLQLTIGQIFVYQFQFLLFEFPLILLAVYFVYAWNKQRSQPL